MAAYLLKIVFLRLDLILERVYVFLELGELLATERSVSQ